jgi:hypothetical protein
MMTNVGIVDRALRLAIGLALIGWAWDWYGPALRGWPEDAVKVLGAYPLITGALRWCPVYALTGISTCAEEG